MPLLETFRGEGCRQICPSLAFSHLHWPQEVAVLKQDHLWRLCKHRVPELLGIPIDIAAVVDVDPSATVSARSDVVKIAHDFITLILLKVLIVIYRIACLGASVDAIEH